LCGCQGIGTDVPDRSANAVQSDGFHDGHVDHAVKGHSEAVSPSPQNQPARPPQMNLAAGNHPFPKSFLDGDFEFVRLYVLCYCICSQIPSQRHAFQICYTHGQGSIMGHVPQGLLQKVT